MGEHRVRELNDEINKLNKTKSYWDSRIIELGGGDQGKGRKFYDVEGNILFFKYLLSWLFFLSSTYEVFNIFIRLKALFPYIFWPLFMHLYIISNTSLHYFCITVIYFFSRNIIYLFKILSVTLFRIFLFCWR